MKSRVSWPFVLIAFGALMVAVIAIVLAPRGDSQVPMSPTNAAPGGSRALSQVLMRHSVNVHEATSLESARATLRGHRTTLVVTDPDDIPAPEFRQLLHAAGSAHIVVVEPSDVVRRELFPAASASASDEGLIYPSRPGAARHVINDGAILTNGTITEGNNAQLAIRSLGSTSDLVWISDWQGRATAEAQHGLAWPRWFTPLVWALALSTLFLIAARGRRFGRLATEPLPVVVRSIESTRALATLYRRSKARDAAASALQNASAARLARHLGLPRGARSATDVVAALAPPQQSRASCLVAPPPESDQELIELATRLAALEKEIISE